MNGQLGRGLILLALVAAALGMVAGFAGGAKRSEALGTWTRRAAHIFSFALIFANLVMVKALLEHDFSVSYVSKVGSRSSPTWVTIVSLWSSLEGSILFWGAILGGFTTWFAFVYRKRFEPYMPFALAVVLAVGVFFCFLLAGPADPFVPVSPVPADGPGPNPLLQNHILMVLHPPSLYLGYVGLTIPFAIAMAAVLRGELATGWLKALRRWTLIPWLFLTIGIVLGGWWAYEVLGWGGYWAWDPVENASFLPWLAATAYLHATVVHERKRVLKMWTLSLVIAAFLLTLLGTFMTRSGVFNSVHSFSQSAIGPLFLIFIGIMTLFSLGALVGRSHLLEAEGKFESIWSREAAFLINNVLLVTFTFTVLLGTVYPLITEAVRGVKLSVGEPYFNQVATPLGMLLVFLMGVGPALPWGKSDATTIRRALLAPAIIGVVAGIICFAAGVRTPLTLVTFALSGFAMAVTLREMFEPAILRARNKGENLLNAFVTTVRAARRRFGGYVVHVGVILTIAAIAGSHAYKLTAEATLAEGQAFEVGDYTLVFKGMRRVDKPHRMSILAVMEVKKDGDVITEMRPTMNFYPTQREPVGTPDVKSFLHEDLYLTLLTFEQDGSGASIKAFVNPMVPWIWWALPLIGFGTLIAFWPGRSRPLPSPNEDTTTGAA